MKLKDIRTPLINTTKGAHEWVHKGKLKQTFVMNHEALIDTWEVVHEYTELITTLAETNNLPPSWNKHDIGIMTGFETHIAPFNVKIGNELGRFLDPIEDQIFKYYKAVRKIHLHVDERDISKPEFMEILGIDPPKRMLSKEELYEHCEQRRRMKTELFRHAFK